MKKYLRNKDRIPAIFGGTSFFNKVIPITEPTISSISALKKKYEEVLRSRMITNSKYVKEFEKNVAEYLGVKYAVAVSSCTSGLMLIIKSLELKGEVILPSFTFHATAHSVVWNGLKPIFVDCDPKTYNIDPKEVEKAITKKTSAILAVHLFGNPANTEDLERIAKKHNLKLIFDAAHAFGAKRRGKNVGGFGDAESFSLSPTKLLTSGEGGIIATNNKDLAEKLKVARNYGDSGNYDCEFTGFNARMSEFNAILGIETLRMLEKNVNRRNKIANIYKSELSKIPGISFQYISPSDRSTFKDFSIYIDENKFGMTRDELYDAVLKENIVVKKYFYPPVHLQKAYKNIKTLHKLDNTENITSRVFSLPLYSHIDEKTVRNICFVIKNIYEYNLNIKRLRK